MPRRSTEDIIYPPFFHRPQHHVESESVYWAMLCNLLRVQPLYTFRVEYTSGDTLFSLHRYFSFLGR
ncbi:hypothetical protein C8Q74DRAFT_1280607 [Fomes fomentarius]|nr:hypothetical protein C8Q74DRAFT_1280607 [Fomes fomentarius]